MHCDHSERKPEEESPFVGLGFSMSSEMRKGDKLIFCEKTPTTFSPRRIVSLGFVRCEKHMRALFSLSIQSVNL